MDRAEAPARLALLLWGGIALATLGFVVGTFELSLVSDDYFLLVRAERSCLLPAEGFARYSPAGLCLLRLLDVVTLGHPGSMHALVALLHLTCGLQVRRLALRLGLDRSAGTAAALLFLTHPFVYEAVFWLSAAVFYLPMTLLVLEGTIRALDRRAPASIADLSLLAGAALCHEIGLALAPLAALAERLTGRPAGWVWRTGARLVVAGALLGLGVALTGSVIVVDIPPAVRWANALLLPWHLLMPWRVPNPFRVGDSLGIIALAPAVAAISGLALLAYLRPASRRLGFSAIAAALASIPWVLLSSVQARYLYLPIAFAAVLLADLLHLPSRRAPTATDRWRWHTAAGLVCFAIACAGGASLLGRLAEWREASRLADALTSDAIAALERCATPAAVGLVDWPDGLGTAPWTAYAFRTGGPDAIRRLGAERKLWPPTESPAIRTIGLPGERYGADAAITPAPGELWLVAQGGRVVLEGDCRPTRTP